MTSSETFIWLNGRILRTVDAHISPLDRGFNLGEGVFETLRSYSGRAFAITRHWYRIKHACRLLGIMAPEQDVFTSAIEETLKANEADDVRIRFTISSGPPQEKTNKPTCAVTIAEAPVYEDGESISIVPWPHNERSPLAGIKSISYADNLLAAKLCKARGCGEAVFANTAGQLCEGATSNIFLVNADGELCTPPLHSGCLPGVTRALVIETARANGMTVLEKDIPIASLMTAQEVFLTSSTREVQSVSHIDDESLFQSPGPYCRRLAELLKKIIQENSDP